MPARASLPVCTAIVFSFIFLSMLLTAAGQDPGTGNLSGVISMDSEVLPGVRVQVVRPDFGAVVSTLTNDTGRYQFSSLAPGAYTITATFPFFSEGELSGFSKVERRVEIQAEQTRELDLEIDLLGGVGEPLGQNCPSDSASGSPAQAVDARDFMRLDFKADSIIYSVEVRGNGAVSWRGEGRLVLTQGAKDAVIEQEAARALIERFRNPAFWNLCGNYESRRDPSTGRVVLWSDGSTTTITAHIADREKAVTDYAESAPAVVQEMHREIERAADVHRWIHGESKTEVFSAFSRGNPIDDAHLMIKPGITALMSASGKGDVRKARAELAAKPDLNARDSSGWTALMYAAAAGNPEVIQALLSAGADLRARSDMGQTALVAASIASHEVARVLITAGADVNTQDWNGHTALMLAAHTPFGVPGTFPGRVETLAVLYAAGARVDTADTKGLTVFDHLNMEAAENPPEKAKYEQMKQILRSPIPGAAPVRVAGRVIDSANSALQALVFRRVGTGVDDIQAQVASDGAFEFLKILPGTYTVHPFPEPSFPISPQTVNVANQSVAGLEIVIAGLREIVVRVAVEGNGPTPALTLALARAAGGFNHEYPLAQHTGFGEESPLPESIVSALRDGADLQLIGAGTPEDRTLLYWMRSPELFAVAGQRTDGAYTLIVPDGEYRFAALVPRVFPPDARIGDSPKAAYIVKSATYGATDLLAKPLVIDRIEKNEIRITMAPAP